MKIIITENQLNKLPLWKTKRGKLQKKYEFDNFESVVKFFNLISKEQEKQNHHAELLIKPTSVEVELIDHEKGKVSEKCHKLAQAFDKIFNKQK